MHIPSMVTDSGDSKTRCSCILRCFELPYVALNVLPCSFLEFFRGPVSILPILEKHVAKHGVVVDAVVVVAAVAVAGCVGAAVVLRRLLSLRWALPEQGEASRLISGRKLPGCHGGGWPRFHLCEIENQISVPILPSAPSAPHSHSTKSQTVEIGLSAQPGETNSQILTGAPGDAQQSAMCACRAGVCIAARPPGHASLSGSPRDMRALPLEESDFSTNRMTAIEVP